MKKPNHYSHNLAIMSLVSSWLVVLKGIIINKTFVLSPCGKNGSRCFSKDVFLFNFQQSNPYQHDREKMSYNDETVNGKLYLDFVHGIRHSIVLLFRAKGNWIKRR